MLIASRSRGRVCNYLVRCDARPLVNGWDENSLVFDRGTSLAIMKHGTPSGGERGGGRRESKRGDNGPGPEIPTTVRKIMTN